MKELPFKQAFALANAGFKNGPCIHNPAVGAATPRCTRLRLSGAALTPASPHTAISSARFWTVGVDFHAYDASNNTF